MPGCLSSASGRGRPAALKIFNGEGYRRGAVEPGAGEEAAPRPSPAPAAARAATRFVPDSDDQRFCCGICVGPAELALADLRGAARRRIAVVHGDIPPNPRTWQSTRVLC